MSKYIIRLDDACEYWNKSNWIKIQKLLYKYEIKPLVGIIPNCEDEQLRKYPRDNDFLKVIEEWKSKNWLFAMHGYNHVYLTKSGGINPVNHRSEFAGVSLDTQKKKIKQGIKVLKEKNIEVKVFFAPSHTFDDNTIIALKEESDIRIISDTISNKSYMKDGITFVPQQSGMVRNIWLDTVTFCYHPNTMENKDFIKLEEFIKNNRNKFISFPTNMSTRKRSIFDIMIEKIYFIKRKLVKW